MKGMKTVNNQDKKPGRGKPGGIWCVPGDGEANLEKVR